MLTTIQDMGRVGMRKYGMGASGAADLASAINANIHCGNPPGAALLECTYVGPVIKFYTDCLTCVSGANVSMIVNDKVIDEGVFSMEEGDVLKIKIVEGSRAYIAFQGGIDAPAIQGSRSMDTVSHCCGGALKDGYVVHTLQGVSRDPHAMLHPPDYSQKLIYFYPGPEYDLLSDKDKQQIESVDWKISSKSSRHSYMLKGSPIPLGTHHMLSSPVLPGTIQIPPSGLPIILGNDSQTTGGYPRIGILEPESYQILSQKTPGSSIRLSKLVE